MFTMSGIVALQRSRERLSSFISVKSSPLIGHDQPIANGDQFVQVFVDLGVDKIHRSLLNT